MVSNNCFSSFVFAILHFMLILAWSDGLSALAKNSLFRTSESDEFWSTFSGTRIVDYGPKGHPYERFQRRREQQQSVDGKLDDDIEYDEDAGEYKPIRISFATDQIELRLGQSDEIDEQVKFIIDTLLPRAAEKWAKHLSVIPVASNITVRADDCAGRFPDLKTQVFNNTDLVILVGGNFSETCNEALAYAFVCTADIWYRPVVSFMNFCLGGNATDSETNQDLVTFLQDSFGSYTNKTFRASHIEVDKLAVTTHEMGHALGILSPLFTFFRNKDGTPLTTPNLYGSYPVIEKRCANGTLGYGMYPSEQTVQTIQNENGRWFQYMVTPRVRQVARNHFNCPSIPGARLEDHRECIGTHWNERDLYTELLSPAISSLGETVLSPFTLALLDDSGWYQVDYAGSQSPAFGVGAGCDFVTEDCIINEKIPSWVNGEFCISPLEIATSMGMVSSRTLNSVFCEPSHQSWALCDLFKMPDNVTILPGTEFYFDDHDLRPEVILADSCPTYAVPLGLDCTIEDTYNVFYPGEKVGKSSKCFNAHYSGSSGEVIYQPACAEVVCDGEAKAAIVRLGGVDLTCEYGGQEILIPGTDNSFIQCPRLGVLCPSIFTCPNACSGRGECLFANGSIPVCSCFESTDDPSCAVPAVVAARGPTPSPTSLPSRKPSMPTTISPNAFLPVALATIAPADFSVKEPSSASTSLLTNVQFYQVIVGISIFVMI